MIFIQLTPRQHQIIAFVKEKEPATGDQIAKYLNLTRATIRADLSILTMTGILDARPKVGYFFSGLEENPVLYNTVRQIKVLEIMSPPTIITKETSVYDAIVTLFLEDVGSLYVTEENMLIGLVSRKDLLKSAIAGSATKTTPVATIMSRMPNLYTIDKTDTILTAMEMLTTHQVDSLPVLETSENNLHVVGKISKTTMTQLFVDTLKKV
ncbi:helix-turn-helix transcriptional regulator [Listeria sp. PSOL-1]|uniref:helix-turn-helix transcriptional regulator n=1 Tax=Listeria sp. PSOL-1 TaxID=1844999 RepID=UPI0013D6C03A|nr:helix-turn-helix transcriptional regulator [Listeria sp. PSOL-1]